MQSKTLYVVVRIKMLEGDITPLLQHLVQTESWKYRELNVRMIRNTTKYVKVEEKCVWVIITAIIYVWIPRFL